MATLTRIRVAPAGKIGRARARRSKQPIPVGIYPDKVSLFVPDEGMWALHRATRPEAVCTRAGIDPSQFRVWRRQYGEDHWLFDWLYNLCDVPKGIKERRERRSKPAEIFAAKDFYPSQEMRLFRAAASVKAAVAAANSNLSRKWKIAESTVHTWLRKTDQAWLRGFLLAGRDAPFDVVVATEGMCKKMATACKPAGVLLQIDMQHKVWLDWLARFPADRENRFKLLYWLFGERSADGWFVISERLERLRGESSPRAICRAAKIAFITFRGWERAPAEKAALEEAVAFASRGNRGREPTTEAWRRLYDEKITTWRHPNALTVEEEREVRRRLASGELPGKIAQAIGVGTKTVRRIKAGTWRPKSYNRSRNKMRDCMLAYARASTQAKRLERAGISGPDWQRFQDEAEAVGCKQALIDHVEWRLDKTKDQKTATTGVIAPRLFRPAPRMWEFRAAASVQFVEQKIAVIKSEIPCFEEWFLDVVEPRDYKGRRPRPEPAVFSIEVRPNGSSKNGHAAGQTEAARLSPADLARGEWLWKQVDLGRQDKEIIQELRKNAEGWGLIETPMGIRYAVQRFCTEAKKDPPRRRRRGAAAPIPRPR